jgi:hypothetical protein
MENTMGAVPAVRVEKPPGCSLGLFLSDMRTWLDHQGIQPIEFKAMSMETGGISVEVFFGRQPQAALFRQAFGSVALAY